MYQDRFLFLCDDVTGTNCMDFVGSFSQHNQQVGQMQKICQQKWTKKIEQRALMILVYHINDIIM